MKAKEDWNISYNIRETWVSLFGRKFVFGYYKNGRCHILFASFANLTAHQCEQKQTHVDGSNARIFSWRLRRDSVQIYAHIRVHVISQDCETGWEVKWDDSFSSLHCRLTTGMFTHVLECG